MEVENAKMNAYSILVVTIALVFAVFAALVFIKPLLKDNENQEKERLQLEADYKRYINKKTILSEYKDNQTSKQKLDYMKERIEDIIPETEKRTAIYAQVDGIVKDKDIFKDTNNIFVSSVSVDSKASKSSSETKKGTKTDGAIDLTVSIEGEGEYFYFIKALRSLELSKRLFNVKSIELSPKEGKVVTFKLNLATYYKEEVQLEK